MCELLGFSSRRRRAANGLLREFFSHAETQPHGWGLARFGGGSVPIVDKEPVKATDSDYLRSRMEEPIEDTTLLAHIRLATVGSLKFENCHPFVASDNRGRTWTLVHNGTIFNGAALNEYVGLQYGETDSERVLLHLIDLVNREQLRRSRPLGESERFDVLSGMVERLSGGNKLNLLVFDGEVLYAHCNFRGSLHWRCGEGEIAFSTRPLSSGSWEDVPFTRLVAVKAGEVVRTGPAHGREYVYNPEDYRLIYMDFAEL